MPRREELNNEQWKVIERVLLKPKRRTDGRSMADDACGRSAGLRGEAGRARTIARCSTASYGYCARVRRGRTCRNAFRHTRPATGDSSIGSMQEYSGTFWKRWPKICESEANWTWRSASSTAPL